MMVERYVLAAAVVGLLGAIAVSDARRMRIPPAMVVALVCVGVAWLIFGGGREAVGTVAWEHVAGVAFGVGVPGAIIAAAQARGRRWPIYPGDAMLLGAVGAVVGLRLLAWSIVIGCALAIVHRVCVQLRRGRRIVAGYLPAGPGLSAGAALVFVAVNAGFAFSAQEGAPPAAAPARIAATELLLAKTNFPPELANKTIVLAVGVPLHLPALVARIGEQAGVEVEIQERPARIAGGGTALPAAPAFEPGGERGLRDLLDEVTHKAGYSWEWKAGRVVVYRYWDTGWLTSRAAEVPAAFEPEASGGGLIGWLKRLFEGGGTAAEESEGGVAPENAVTAVLDADKELAAEEVVAEALAPDDDGPKSAAGEEKPGMEAEPGAAKAAETLSEAVPARAEDLEWHVDPEGQKTVRGVLEAWAEKAEWKIAWRAREDFSVGAAATFSGEFLEAVDLLLSDPRVSRSLVVRAYANRYLVVESAGG